MSSRINANQIDFEIRLMQRLQSLIFPNLLTMQILKIHMPNFIGGIEQLTSWSQRSDANHLATWTIERCKKNVDHKRETCNRIETVFVSMSECLCYIMFYEFRKRNFFFRLQDMKLSWNKYEKEVHINVIAKSMRRDFQQQSNGEFSRCFPWCFES